ncbi:MAG: DUF2238 domain-containing protein [Clostridia bacterium]|nr:DUF2238 domain-containing protein [Clostridia bacterium]
MNKSVNVKIFTSLAVLLLNCICTALVFFVPIESTSLKIIGSFLSIALVSAIVWSFPIRFYIMTLSFVFFASSLGSCLNLYRHLSYYDLFVHFLSGILLFDGGRIIIEYISRRRNLPKDKVNVGLFALFFSCACAAFWEIFEYLCDVFINAEMQGTKANTMGDIIAGVLGAMIGAVGYFFIDLKRKKY